MTSSDLLAFYQRRKVATSALAVARWEQSFLLGSSVVAGSLLDAFTPNEPNTFQFHGLYALSLALFVSYILGSEVILPLFKHRPQHRNLVTIILAMLFPLAFVLGGASLAPNPNSVALLYIAFAVVLGASLSVYDVFTRLESTLWWGPDGKKNVGIGILGFWTGFGAIFYTLVSGWLVAYVSLAACLYVVAGIQWVLSLYVSVSVWKGQLDSPPTAEDVNRWMEDASDIEKTKTHRDEWKLPDIGDDTSQSSDSPSSKVCISESPVESEPSTSHHIGTTHLVPVKLNSRLEALKYPAVILMLVELGAMTFNGYATKVLLSSMFELLFSLPKITAAYLSALSLVLYLVGRAAIPYFLLDRHLPSTLICSCAAGVSAVAYAVLPSVIADEQLGPEFSWRLLGFVCVKSVIGLTFACMGVLSTPQMYDLVGDCNLQIVQRLGWPLIGVTGTAGPIVAYTTTMARHYSGMSYPQAFSLFFYIAAGVAVINMLANVAMHVMLHRKKQQ